MVVLVTLPHLCKNRNSRSWFNRVDEHKRLLDYLLKVFSIQSECFEVLMMLNQLGRTVVRQVLLWSGKDELTLVFLVFWRL